ncbi:hypothetical protein AAVH_29302 [Aphelenchoides avenae]|nr:hypothetical protein AAVH_29302 [Aphelenchus avenae]
MSKLFVALLAFSTVPLAVGHKGFNSLNPFLNNPKIKLLSNPAVQDAYPRAHVNYSDLLKALAKLQEPIAVEKVKEVLKEQAPKFFQRVEAAGVAFAQIRDSITIPEAKSFVAQAGEILEKYYFVGLPINELATEGEALHKLYDGLTDETKKVVVEKLQEAAGLVEQTLYEVY